MAQATPTSPSHVQSNARSLWLLLAANILGFYLAAHLDAVRVGGWPKFAAGLVAVIPAGVGVALTGLLNSLVSADTKARLVFWRWHYPLPGCRAFTQNHDDDRFTMEALAAKHGPLPTDPKAQNALWFQLMRTVSDEPSVSSAHRHFLFARDFAFMSLLMLIILGIAAEFFIHPVSTAEIYVLLLAVQWGIATRAANVGGHRFVTNVLALSA